MNQPIHTPVNPPVDPPVDPPTAQPTSTLAAQDPVTRELVERALAAERTVEVLKLKVQALYNGDQSQIQRQRQRAQDREARARQREDTLRARAQDLERYNDALAAEVRQRTRDLRMILDHVSFGFLTLDPLGVVSPDYTRSCVALLEREALQGQTWASLVGLSHEASNELELNLLQLFEDIMPEELTLEQLPKRYVMPSGRVLHVGGSLIRDEQEQPIRLLLTISDATALEQAQRESQEHKLLIQLIKNQEAFRLLLEDIRALLAHSRVAIPRGDQISARRHVHTIKGNVGAFGLMELVGLIHAIEGEPTITAEAIDQIERALQRFLTHHQDVLGIPPEAVATHQEDHYQISQAQLERLHQIARAIEAPQAGSIFAWTRDILKRPAHVLLGPADQLVTKLAARMEKRVRFEVEGLDTLVDPELMRPIFQNVTHLLRNSLDHGLETPEQRLAANKPEEGTLRLILRDQGSQLELHIEDDGRGIDTERLIERGVRDGLLSEQEARALDPAQRVELIFIDRLSTAERCTEVSGRGVGTSAMRAAVLAARGRISVHTQLGHGTRFQITIPKLIDTTLLRDAT